MRFTPSADKYLAHLRTVDAELLPKEDTWLDRLPPTATVPLLRRPVDAAILRKVLEAIRKRLALRVHYQSQSSSDPKWRWIAPHALGFSGFRWHARAWCFERSDFRDFVLARIIATNGTKESESQPDRDSAWQQEVVLRPVEIDCGMEQGVIEIRMRIALSHYFERLLALDFCPDEPNRQPLVLLNRDEVEDARTRARNALTQRDVPGE